MQMLIVRGGYICDVWEMVHKPHLLWADLKHFFVELN